MLCVQQLAVHNGFGELCKQGVGFGDLWHQGVLQVKCGQMPQLGPVFGQKHAQHPICAPLHSVEVMLIIAASFILFRWRFVHRRRLSCRAWACWLITTKPTPSPTGQAKDHDLLAVDQDLVPPKESRVKEANRKQRECQSTMGNADETMTQYA